MSHRPVLLTLQRAYRVLGDLVKMQTLIQVGLDRTQGSASRLPGDDQAAVARVHSGRHKSRVIGKVAPNVRVGPKIWESEARSSDSGLRRMWPKQTVSWRTKKQASENDREHQLGAERETTTMKAVQKAHPGREALGLLSLYLRSSKQTSLP